MSNIGIMNEAYFVGRRELISWINDFLKLNVSKVEECATGAIHCQILDAIYPKKVPMSRVNFNAKTWDASVKNFKILQKVFKENGVTKVVPVERLLKAKYQDNFEFLQWMYAFFKSNFNGRDYDPVGRRNVKRGGRSGATVGRHNANKENVGVKKMGAEKKTSVLTRVSSNRSKAGALRRGVRGKPAPTPTRSPTLKKDVSSPAVMNALRAKIAQLETDLLDAHSQVAAERRKAQAQSDERTQDMADLEQEKNFYCNKVMAVEKLCEARIQSLQACMEESVDDEAAVERCEKEIQFCEQIMEVLYAEHKDEEGEEETTMSPEPSPQPTEEVVSEQKLEVVKASPHKGSPLLGEAASPDGFDDSLLQGDENAPTPQQPQNDPFAQAFQAV